MNSVFRPAVEQMAGYVPGEQPRRSDWVKLNTNENPYPPSPRVVEAIRRAAEGRLNVYPDPHAGAFRAVAARLYDVDPDWILPANGSDENLTIIVRSFCDDGDVLSYPYPSYVLYESLAQIQGCRVQRLLLNADWAWDEASARALRAESRVMFVPNPNSPSGTLWSTAELQQVIPDHGVLVIDQAYADFCSRPQEAAILRQDAFAGRAVITRTLSKSYSLAGIRFGFAIADPALIAGMRKVKDSYNCDAIAIAAATAALEDQDWMLQNRERILRTRDRLASQLPELGFSVLPGEANFLWTTHVTGAHGRIHELLRERHILVRWMQFPDATPDGGRVEGIRITVGTDAEIDRLLEAMAEVVRQLP